MSARTDTDAALAAERQESDTEASSLASQVASLQDQVAGLEQQLADCEAANTVGKSRTLFGANFGGYKDKGETMARAVPRIKAGFGSPDVARWWWSKPPTSDIWTRIPSLFAGMSLVIELDGSCADIMAGKWDAPMRAMCQNAPTDRRHWWTFKHEQDNGKASPAEFTPAADRLAKIHKNNSPPTLRSCPSMPMGVAFNGVNPYWRNYLPKDMSGWDALALDAYQQGKTDATAWTAKRTVGNAFDGAKELGKGLVIGELGSRRTNQYPDGISDDARAKFLNDFLSQYADSANYRKGNGSPILEAVCYFESSDGNPLKLPWMLLPYSDGSGVKSPKAAAVWKAACSR